MGPIQHAVFDKIPTTICYDQEGKVLKTGEPFIGEIPMTNNFKTCFLERTVNSLTDTEKHISNYLFYFFNDVLSRFQQEEGLAKRQVKATWYLTVPGCWSEKDKRDFQDLAQQVSENVLPASVALVDLTESRASCEFLVQHLKLDIGIWAITCDIGGATIDTALCQGEAVEGKIVPKDFPVAFNTLDQLGYDAHNAFGVVSIDTKLGQLLRSFSIGLRTIEKATNPDTEELEKIRFLEPWQTFRHNFQDESDFMVTVKRLSGNFNFESNGISIRGKTLTISRSVFFVYIDMISHSNDQFC